MGALLKKKKIISHLMSTLNEFKAVALQAARQLLLASTLGWGKMEGSFSFVMPYDTHVSVHPWHCDGSLPLWRKGRKCSRGTDYVWASAAPKTQVRCQLPALCPSPTLIILEYSLFTATVAADQGPLSPAGPPRAPGVPLGALHQTAQCKARFQPCKEGWAGEEEAALARPPCFSEAFVS